LKIISFVVFCNTWPMDSQTSVAQEKRMHSGDEWIFPPGRRCRHTTDTGPKVSICTCRTI